MNNYPHCFPTSASLKAKLRAYFKQPEEQYSDEEKKAIVWGLSGWEDIMDTE